MSGPLWSYYYWARETPHELIGVFGALIPLTIGIVVAASTLVCASLPGAWHRARARERSAAILVMLVAGTLWLPYSPVPYESVFLPLAGLASAHAKALLATGFGWDQDQLAWKVTFGVGGWHDLPFPDFVYAASRWVLSAGMVALPIASWRFTAARPRAAAALLSISSCALSVAVVGLALRHHNLQHPQMRYVAPLLPLILLPLLARTDRQIPPGAFRVAMGTLVLLSVWLSIDLMAARYLLGPAIDS
jgi:hypothetical protein